MSSLTEATAYCSCHGYSLPHPTTGTSVHTLVCSAMCTHRPLENNGSDPSPLALLSYVTLSSCAASASLRTPPQLVASTAAGVVRGQLLPTHRFPNGHFTTTRRGHLENWLSRARLLSGKDCHKIRLPLELKGPHHGGQGGRRKQRRVHMLWALLRRAVCEFGISKLLFKIHNSTKNRSNFLLTMKTSYFSSGILKGDFVCLNFLSPSLFPNNCSHSNNKFGPLFKFVLSFSFPFKNM